MSSIMSLKKRVSTELYPLRQVTCKNPFEAMANQTKLFEHMKNYELLMSKVGRALKPGGKLFVHIFAHKTTPYDFEEGWMSTHFFVSRINSLDLELHFGIWGCDASSLHRF